MGRWGATETSWTLGLQPHINAAEHGGPSEGSPSPTHLEQQWGRVDGPPPSPGTKETEPGGTGRLGNCLLSPP